MTGDNFSQAGNITFKAFSDGILNFQHSEMESHESLQFDLRHFEMESVAIFFYVNCTM